MKHLRKVLSLVRRADLDFSLIDNNDKIVLGVSGGKDSLAMLHALSLYGKFSGKDFTIIPVFLDLGFEPTDLQPIKDYCEKIGFPLVVNDSRFVYEVLQSKRRDGETLLPCSICSRMKKAAINAAAKDLGANKVAFAHHNDDAVETLLMNMIHGGRVATFEPKMYLERADITFIRPLIYCFEDDIEKMVKEEELPVFASKCPNDKKTERNNAKEYLHNLYKLYPNAKENFRTMLVNYENFELFFNQIEWEEPGIRDYTLKPVITANDGFETNGYDERLSYDERAFLIQKNHKKVGELSVLTDGPHKFYIKSLSGNLEDLESGITIAIERYKKKAKFPCSFFLLTDNNELSSNLKFELKPDYSNNGTLMYTKIFN